MQEKSNSEKKKGFEKKEILCKRISFEASFKDSLILIIKDVIEK